MEAPGTQPSVTHKSGHWRVSNDTPSHRGHRGGEGADIHQRLSLAPPVDPDTGSGNGCPGVSGG